MEELPLEYVAGLFDGEGWFSITRTHHGRHIREFQFQCHAGLVIRERFILEALESMFGGTIREQTSRNIKHNPYYRWRITGHEVLIFALYIKKYVRLKQKQANTVIQFQYLKGMAENKPLTDWQYSEYSRYYEELRLLNERGTGKAP